MRREAIGHNYSGLDGRRKKSGGGLFKFKYLLIVIALCFVYLVYLWVSNPAYAPGFVRDILPNTPQRLFQYTNAEGVVVESPVAPPGNSDVIVINRWTNIDNILPR